MKDHQPARNGCSNIWISSQQPLTEFETKNSDGRKAVEELNNVSQEQKTIPQQVSDCLPIWTTPTQQPSSSVSFHQKIEEQRNNRELMVKLERVDVSKIKVQNGLFTSSGAEKNVSGRCDGVGDVTDNGCSKEPNDKLKKKHILCCTANKRISKPKPKNDKLKLKEKDFDKVKKCYKLKALKKITASSSLKPQKDKRNGSHAVADTGLASSAVSGRSSLRIKKLQRNYAAISNLEEVPYERLMLSLQSPLPNEHELGLTACLTLSDCKKEETNLFSKNPAILTMLLAHAGFYHDIGLRLLLQETQTIHFGWDAASFWIDLCEDDFTKSLVSSEKSKRETRNVFPPTNESHKTVEKMEAHIGLIATILRNFSFQPKDALVMAKHRTMMRLLLVMTSVEHGELTKIGYDIISNIGKFMGSSLSSDNHLFNEHRDDLYAALVESMKETVLYSFDRFQILRALEGLGGMVRSAEDNQHFRNQLIKGELNLFRRIFELLTLKEDPLLVINCLECLLAFTEMKESCDNLLNVSSCVSTLMSFVTANTLQVGTSFRNFQVISNESSCEFEETEESLPISTATCSQAIHPLTETIVAEPNELPPLHRNQPSVQVQLQNQHEHHKTLQKSPLVLSLPSKYLEDAIIKAKTEGRRVQFDLHLRSLSTSAHDHCYSRKPVATTGKNIKARKELLHPVKYYKVDRNGTTVVNESSASSIILSDRRSSLSKAFLEKAFATAGVNSGLQKNINKQQIVVGKKERKSFIPVRELLPTMKNQAKLKKHSENLDLKKNHILPSAFRSSKSASSQHDSPVVKKEKVSINWQSQNLENGKTKEILILESIQFTAVLILRNLVKHCDKAKRSLVMYETELIQIACTTADCSYFVAQVLGFIAT